MSRATGEWQSSGRSQDGAKLGSLSKHSPPFKYNRKKNEKRMQKRHFFAFYSCVETRGLSLSSADRAFVEYILPIHEEDFSPGSR